MQDIPQFVVTRLQKKPATGSHPDADLLTAFAEKSLSERERTLVLEHLAACGDCRDVVALALPVTEVEVSPVGLRPARTGWFSLPTLRWGTLAAGAALVIGAGILQFSHSNQHAMVAVNRAQEAVAAPSGVNQAPSVQTAAPTALMPKKDLPASGSQVLTAQKRANNAEMSSDRQVSRAAGGGAGIGGGVFRDGSIPGASGPETAFAPDLQNPSASAPQPNPSSAAGQPVQQMKVPASSQVVEVQAEAGAINTESAAIGQTQAAQNQVAQNQAQLPLNGRNVTNLSNFDVVKAKDPVPNQAASNSAAASQMVINVNASPTAQSATIRTSPQWTVSSTGVLQRSFDGGSTWQNVNPVLSSASVGGRAGVQSFATADASSSTDETKNDTKKAAQAKPAPNSIPLFRAVAAAGLEVWAGGAGSVLYHSSDGGNRWSLLLPSAAGVVLTGDVVGIQFSDPQHGKISTSTAEFWITSDAGQTWQMQH